MRSLNVSGAACCEFSNLLCCRNGRVCFYNASQFNKGSENQLWYLSPAVRKYSLGFGAGVRTSVVVRGNVRSVVRV